MIDHGTAQNDTKGLLNFYLRIAHESILSGRTLLSSWDFFMLLVIVITLIAIGAVIVGALYSSILPFFAILGSTANYNIAYYGAIASTERALLSVRYHQPWYEGRGGFSGGNALSGVITDLVPHAFGNINLNNNRMTWAITSLTQGLIPAASGGDVESLLQWTGSTEFNMLTYDGVIQLPLYKDAALTSAERYISWWVTTVTAPNDIYVQGTLRLPPKILASFLWADLDTSDDLDQDNIKDDIIVNWGLQGTNSLNSQTFSIIPTISVNYNQETPIYEFENAIRESHVNFVSDSIGTNTPNFFMGEPGGSYEFNVITQPTVALSSLTQHNAVPANEQVVRAWSGFSVLLNEPTLEAPSLTLNLVNKLSSTIDQVFPFLEYQIKVCEIGIGCNVPISDRYFHIDGMGKVGEYEVHIKLDKSVNKKDNTSDFAIVF